VGKANGTYVYTGELVNTKGTTAVQPVTVTVTQAAPGTPQLSHDNHDGDGAFTVTANMWWGTNATSYRFYENGVLVGQGDLAAATPTAQVARLAVTGRAKGSYSYRVDFVNAAGTTSSSTLVVTVKK
jgi:arabinogalactan endo-1,4-beta-galactosidase